MSKQHVIVEILPSLVAVRVTRRGEVVAHREEALDRSDWGGSWMAAQELLGAAMERLVDATGTRGCAATIVYDVPGTSCVVTRAVAKVPTAQALESACLAAESSLAESESDAVSAAHELHRSKGADGGTVHYLACAERDDTLTSLVAIAEAAGLRVYAVAPHDACAITEAVANTMGGDQRPRVVCWIGRHSMAVAISREGQLLTARSVNIGLASLVDAMLRSPGKESALALPTVRTRAEAWEFLLGTGIPMPVPGNGNPSGHVASAILPLLQPVLQRVAIEIKQSLRFEVEAGVREEAVLTLAGPGRFCPGLLETLGRYVGVEIASGAVLASAREHGASFAVADSSMAVPALLPVRVGHRRIVGRVRGGLAVGCTLALALAMQSRFWALKDIQAAQGELSGLSEQLKNAKLASDDEQRLLQVQSHVALARGWMNKQVGDGPSVSAMLHLLSSISVPEICIRSLDLTSNTTGTPQLVLFGMTPTESEGDAADAIRRYLASLEQSPLVVGAKLGATQRVEVEGRTVQSFSVTMDLATIPGNARVAIMETQP